MILTKEIANEMEIESKFRETCVIRRKKQFNENIDCHKIEYVEESFRIDYFIYIVDQVILHLELDLSSFKYMKIFLDFYSIFRN